MCLLVGRLCVVRPLFRVVFAFGCVSLCVRVCVRLSDRLFVCLLFVVVRRRLGSLCSSGLLFQNPTIAVDFLER